MGIQYTLNTDYAAYFSFLLNYLISWQSTFGYSNPYLLVKTQTIVKSFVTIQVV
ncbi:hypothetical protein KKG56_04365 [bacterium]|nr:hypothetical protein [bacterium]